MSRPSHTPNTPDQNSTKGHTVKTTLTAFLIGLAAGLFIANYDWAGWDAPNPCDMTEEQYAADMATYHKLCSRPD